MELSEITNALNGNADLLNGVIDHVLTTERGTEVIGNRAEVIFKEKIGDELSLIYKKQDDDMFSILGERPTAKEDGGKQKTYEKNKELYTELAELRKQKDSLNKDAKVQELTAKIEQLEKNGGGSHWEQTFNTEKDKWTQREAELKQRAETAENNIVNFKKISDIDAGLVGLKFNEDIPEMARKALIDNVKSTLLKHSKIEGDKVIYLDPNGAQLNRPDYTPQTSADVLKNALKDVLLTENKDEGGGASKTVTGSIETTTSEDGKSTEKLVLPNGSFKTRVEFLQVAEEALLKSGKTRRHPDWDKLKNEAYKRYGVDKLPRQ